MTDTQAGPASTPGDEDVTDVVAGARDGDDTVAVESEPVAGERDRSRDDRPREIPATRRWELDDPGALGRGIDHEDAEEGAGYAVMASVAVAGPVRVAPVAVGPVVELPLELPALLPELFINRELSWLAFNRRVLGEATEPGTPLIERAKFIAIFSDNLDGWFMIRMAGVKRKVVAGITTVGPDGRTPAAQFSAIRERVQELLDRQAEVITGQLLPDLAAAGIEITHPSALSAAEASLARDLFDRDVFPVLTPQGIDAGRPFPHVSGGSLNLIVTLRADGAERFARIKIPATLPSLLPVRRPDDEKIGDGPIRLMWLQDVIIANVQRLFPGVEILDAHPFHVLRDADIEPEEDDDDRHNLLAVMRETLSQRPFGPVVRMIVNPDMPEATRDWLRDQLGALPEDLYVVDGPINGEGFFELLRLDRPDLKDPPFSPPRFRFEPHRRDDDEPEDVFRAISRGDILVHHPYQSFDAFVQFIRAASTDPDVVAIKQTLYRLGKNSPLIPALIEARDDDTQVAVLVELRARFDEESNIQWAEALERRGVHVAYGLAGVKTHCKATMVVRRERDGMRRYLHLGTGNYNASTARTYEDLGLFTRDEDLGADVAELFNALTGFSEEDPYRKIWTAPRQLRTRVLEAIAAEIAAHQRTGRGRLIFKMNQLVDRESIRALYTASRAGVKVDLIIRGICSLRPGVPGWSENIRVVSLVGRFLEHSRVYAFASGGEGPPRVYLGSADLMERNLDRRVEVVFPLEDPLVRSEVWDEILPAYLRDTVNTRELHSDGVWRPVEMTDGQPFDAQRWLQERHEP